MLKKCAECASKELKWTHHEMTEKVAGHAFVMATQALTCGTCGAEYLEGGAQESFDLAIATSLAEAGMSTGPALQFMRKALALKAVDFASMLNIAPETLSRWENGKLPIDRSAMVLVRLLVLERSQKTVRVREQIERAVHPIALGKRVQLESAPASKPKRKAKAAATATSLP